MTQVEPPPSRAGRPPARPEPPRRPPTPAERERSRRLQAIAVRRRKPLGRTLAALGLLIALGALVGFALGRGGDAPTTTTSADAVAFGEGFEVRRPVDWRVGGDAPRVPGLSSVGDSALRLQSPGKDVRFFAVKRKGGLSTAMALPLAARLGESDVDRSLAGLESGLSALRWSGPLSGEGSSELYALPLGGETVLAGCSAKEGAETTPVKQCAQIVDSLSVSGQQFNDLDPDQAYGRELASALGRSDRELREGVARLRTAATPDAQRAAAVALGDRLSGSAERLGGLIAPDLARPWNRRAASALESVAGGFNALGRAAGAEDRTDYAAAQRAIAVDQRRYAEVLSALGAIGYGKRAAGL